MKAPRVLVVAALVVGALVVAAALVAGAAAAGPATRHTAAGNSAARASLLTLNDLGKGWTAKPPAGSGLVLACKGYQPSGKGIVETGAAGTESFASSDVGPFVSQTTSVYATAGQASRLWARSVKPGLIACVAQSLQAIGSKGVKVKITSQGPLTFTKVAGLTAAYRVVATLAASNRSYKRTVYFDVVLVGQGSSLSEITLTSLVSPVPADVEHALALLVAHRIGLPTA